MPVPVSIALVSDFHNSPDEAVSSSLLAHRPDIICIAGDVCYGGTPGEDGLLVEVQENVLPFLRFCADTAPTFLSLGNHELTLCPEDLDLIRQTGVVLLDNTWIRYGSMNIGGLSSHHVLEYRKYRAGKQERYPVRGKFIRQIREPETAWLSEFENQPGYKLLLSHHPEYYPRFLQDRNIDLILSGHAHGGQWRIGDRGLFAPGQGLFPRLTSGVCDGRLVISRGLANTAPLPRFCNPTELVYLQPLH